jgi:hypothetical protein
MNNMIITIAAVALGASTAFGQAARQIVEGAGSAAKAVQSATGAAKVTGQAGATGAKLGAGTSNILGSGTKTNPLAGLKTEAQSDSKVVDAAKRFTGRTCTPMVSGSDVSAQVARAYELGLIGDKCGAKLEGDTVATERFHSLAAAQARTADAVVSDINRDGQITTADITSDNAVQILVSGATDLAKNFERAGQEITAAEAALKLDETMNMSCDLQNRNVFTASVVSKAVSSLQ